MRPAETSDKELLRRYHVEGDLAARERLIEQYLSLVRTLARRYAYRGEQLEDVGFVVNDEQPRLGGAAARGRLSHRRLSLRHAVRFASVAVNVNGTSGSPKSALVK